MQKPLNLYRKEPENEITTPSVSELFRDVNKQKPRNEANTCMLFKKEMNQLLESQKVKYVN